MATGEHMPNSMILAALLGLLLPHSHAALDPALAARADQARATLTQDLVSTQLADGSWDGPFEGDPSTDGMMLLLGAKLGKLDATLIQESVDRIFSSPLLRDGLWSAYIGGPASPEVTASIILGLEKAGIPRTDPRVATAWRFYREKGGVKKLHLLFRMLLTALGAAERKSLPYLSPKFLALPKIAPVNFFNLGLARAALVPMLVWSHYGEVQDRGGEALPMDPERLRSVGLKFGHPISTLFSESRRIPFLDTLFGFATPDLEHASSVEELIHLVMTWADRLTPGNSEFWAQEAIGWMLMTTQEDGTWAGVFQATALTLLALDQARALQVDDFTAQIDRGWQGLIGWRRRLPNGQVFQQFSEGPIMESARILTAFQADGGTRRTTHDSERRLADYLVGKQIHGDGDWMYRQPRLQPGGWAYQKFNSRYPDIDDTAMVLEGLAGTNRHGEHDIREAISSGTNWMIGMQNSDGGFSAWEKDTPVFMQELFALSQGMDVLIDPSEADVTARVIRALVTLKRLEPSLNRAVLDRSIERACTWLIGKAQWEDSAQVWIGDWAINRAYGTAEVVTALLESRCWWHYSEAGPSVRWLANLQNADGGWGESPESYLVGRFVPAASTADLTGFVLNALLAYQEQAGQDTEAEVVRAIEDGVRYLTLRVETRTQPELEEGMGATLFKGLLYGRYIHLPQYEALRALNRALAN